MWEHLPGEGDRCVVDAEGRRFYFDPARAQGHWCDRLGLQELFLLPGRWVLCFTEKWYPDLDDFDRRRFRVLAEPEALDWLLGEGVAPPASLQHLLPGRRLDLGVDAPGEARQGEAGARGVEPEGPEGEPRTESRGKARKRRRPPADGEAAEKILEAIDEHGPCTGIALQHHTGYSHDHVRDVAAVMVKANRLVNTPDGYRRASA